MENLESLKATATEQLTAEYGVYFSQAEAALILELIRAVEEKS